MNLQAVTTYRLDGQIFMSLKAAKAHLENEVGKVIDSTAYPLSPKERLAVYAAILANKKRLVELLSVRVEMEGDGVTTEDRDENLLDLDI